MIQRRQSIYLFLAMAFTALLWISPFDFLITENHEELENVPAVFADGKYNINDHIIFSVLATLGAIVSFLAIFLFRNRKLQIRISQFALLLNVALLIISLVIFYMSVVEISNDLIWQPYIGWVNPVLASLCIIFAIKLIQKDEKLVKSMDRLR